MCTRWGSQLFTSGHVSAAGTEIVTGKLGDTLDVDQGRAAARLAALSLLATVHAELGDLDQVAQVLQVLVTVNATPDFTDHTAVADAASDVLVVAFGEDGRHARLAVGVSSLPANLALEVQATFGLRG